MLGYDPEGFLKDSSWLELVHPEDHDMVKEIMTGLVDGKYPSNSLAYRIKTKEGIWKWILAFTKVVSFQNDGKAANIIGTHLDIDFIKEKEIELENTTKELRKTNAELQKFAYITSHNLRAPVVNLMSLTEMQSEEALSPELHEEINHKIHYCVITTGFNPGRPDKFGKKIFGLYQRFHSKIDGKGLGLYIVKSQIESMDGKIEVNSVPDSGTTFEISFKNPANS